MSPKILRQIGIALTVIGFILIIVALLGMTGITAKWAPSRDLVIPAMLFTAAGGIARRRARRDG